MSEHVRKKLGWFAFSPESWRGDAPLRSCTPTARILWLELLLVMHEANPRGYLLVGDAEPSVSEIAKMAGLSEKEVRAGLTELGRKRVFSVDVRGRKFSRKMVADSAKSEQKSQNRRGKNGVDYIEEDTRPFDGRGHENATDSRAIARRDPETQRPRDRDRLESPLNPEPESPSDRPGRNLTPDEKLAAMPSPVDGYSNMADLLSDELTGAGKYRTDEANRAAAWAVAKAVLAVLDNSTTEKAAKRIAKAVKDFGLEREEIQRAAVETWKARATINNAPGYFVKVAGDLARKRQTEGAAIRSENAVAAATDYRQRVGDDESGLICRWTQGEPWRPEFGPAPDQPGTFANPVLLKRYGITTSPNSSAGN